MLNDRHLLGINNYVLISEQFLRLEQRALFGGLSSRQSDCLGALIKFAAVCGQVIPSDVIKRHCLRLLSGRYCS